MTSTSGAHKNFTNYTNQTNQHIRGHIVRSAISLGYPWTLSTLKSGFWSVVVTPINIPLFPLSSPLFPDSRMPLRIFEVRYLHMIRQCKKENQPFGIVALREGTEVQRPGIEETMQPVGCLAHLTEVNEIQPSLLMIDTKGGQRFHLEGSERGAYGLWHGRIRLIPEDLPTDIPPDLQPLANKLGTLIADAQKQGVEHQLPITRPYRLDECGWVANQWGMLLDLHTQDKIELLIDDDPLSRLTRIKLLLGL
jgi:uncharacterized protein